MDPQPVPPPVSYQDFARLIDHTLLKPELTDVHVLEGLQLAKRYRIACAIVRPCDVEMAVRTLQGSDVRVGSVCGYPLGIQNTATKLYEARDLLRRGAREIDLVITASKLLSREFQHVQTELAQISESCHKEGAILKVMMEPAWLTDELKIIACRLIERAQADFAGAPHKLEDLRLLRKYLPETIGIKTVGDVETVDQALEAVAAGCSRIGTDATAALLEEWKPRAGGAG
jgi:deoxyribose-phosphate aldolase